MIAGEDAEADRRTIEFLERFIADVGLTQRLRDLGVKESQLDALADQAILDGCHRTNPVPVTRDGLRALYVASF